MDRNLQMVFESSHQRGGVRRLSELICSRLRNLPSVGACVRIIFAAILGAAMSGPVWAQAYPSKIIRLVVPFDVGGPNDVLARVVISEPLSQRLGQRVIVENKPGAAGIVGTEYVTKSPADGYTLAITGNPTLTNKLPFDFEKDLAPVTLIADSPLILTVRPDMKAKNLKEFIALAKSNPGKLNFSSSGTGVPAHLVGELLNQVAGIKTVHLAYKGSSPAANAAVGGQVDFMFGTPSVVLQLVKSGKLSALAATGKRRPNTLPEVPSFPESGFPELDCTTWFGAFAPAGTQPSVITRLNREMVEIIRSSEAREKFARLGLDPIGSTPEEFSSMLKRDIATWTGLIKKAGIEIQEIK